MKIPCIPKHPDKLPNSPYYIVGVTDTESMACAVIVDKDGNFKAVHLDEVIATEPPTTNCQLQELINYAHEILMQLRHR